MLSLAQQRTGERLYVGQSGFRDDPDCHIVEAWSLGDRTAICVDGVEVLLISGVQHGLSAVQVAKGLAMDADRADGEFHRTLEARKSGMLKRWHIVADGERNIVIAIRTQRNGHVMVSVDGEEFITSPDPATAEKIFESLVRAPRKAVAAVRRRRTA